MNHLTQKEFHDLFFNTRGEVQNLFRYGPGTDQMNALFNLGKLIGSTRRKAREAWLATSKNPDQKAGNVDAKAFRDIDSHMFDISKTVEDFVGGKVMHTRALKLCEEELDALFEIVRGVYA